MEKLTPFFKLNGVRYEIKKTRYLLAEYQRLGEELGSTDEEKALATKAISLLQEVKRYAVKLDEFEARFFETLDETDEKRYLKVKEYYQRALNDYAELEGADELIKKVQKKNIDVLEQVAIIGIAEGHFNLDMEKANAVWSEFVADKGNDFVVAWLTQMADCLFETEEDSDDFLSQMRKRSEEQERNRRAGVKRK